MFWYPLSISPFILGCQLRVSYSGKFVKMPENKSGEEQLGFLSALAVYHLLLFFGRRKDYSNLSYTVFCISFGIGFYFRENFKLNSVIQNSIFLLCAHFVAGALAIFCKHIVKIKRVINQKIINYIYIGLSVYFFSLIIISARINNFKILFPAYFPMVSLYASFVLVSLAITYVKDRLYLDKIKLVVAASFMSVVIICIIASIMHTIGQMFSFVIFAVILLVNCVIFANSLSVYLNREHRQLKKTKKTLQELNVSLEEKVKERTQQLADVNKQKTDFFNNIAHETKTPLTLINNYLANFIKNHGEFKELLIIKQNIEKLKNDIVNFLDVEKYERKQIFYNHDQVCDFSNIVISKNIIFKETASQKEIELKWNIDEGLYLKADPVAIDRILNNLLDNAVKYTESGGSIYVRLFQAGDFIKLIVSDTGIGILEEKKEHIFSPYYQLSHKKRNIQGLGLGLHITHQIIKKLNGSISVNSKPGKGSEFIVIFNKYEKQTGDFSADFELTKPIENIIVDNRELLLNVFDPEKKTIFIVEDNLQLIANLKMELEENYNVYFGTNGKDALEKLKTIPAPDIIISDIMMDIMDGYEFRERLIKLEKYKAIPFIFITAKGKVNEKMRGLSQGAVDYICKPFEISELRGKIKNWLLLLKLNSFKEEIELSSKHQSRLDNFIKEYDISLKEKEVLNYLLQGYKNYKIAAKMFISGNTVKKHIERIKKKLNVVKKDELIKYLYDYVYK